LKNGDRCLKNHTGTGTHIKLWRLRQLDAMIR